MRVYKMANETNNDEYYGAFYKLDDVRSMVIDNLDLSLSWSIDYVSESYSLVNFRKFEGEIIAFFPFELADNDANNMSSYAHIGQHSAASVGFYDDTSEAKPSEYEALYDELEGQGYSLQMIDAIPNSALAYRKFMLSNT